ncbi:MAG: hypothetical protein K2K63_15310 [Acetatifactor sp.]|nr:hypothetical protein [Acetatifactor sp.]
MTNITINTSKVLNTVSPMLYGIFFEDINYAGDGGLYGELIANRSFEYYEREVNPAERPADSPNIWTMCWEAVGDCRFTIERRFPLSKAHRHYARLSGKAGTGLRNLGFCGEGLSVHEGQTFRFSCYVRNTSSMKLTVRFTDKSANLYGSKTFSLVRGGRSWSKYKLTLTATGSCSRVYPEILLESEGTLDLDLISLFPTDTYHGRENGMRRDIAEMLEGLHPAFMRFPGGCIVEGRSFENMYCWKDTIGPLWERRTNWNRWQMEEYQINGQSSPDYFQSYGLGYYEYFCLCEDLGAKPVPVMNVGMTCQWHEALLVDMDKLDKWIQDILDLIEFANGPEDSEWGRRRAEMGHPAPFGLEYIGIGNEQWGDVYFQRYEAFQRALSEKHPEIKLITCAGWTSDGEDFDTACRWMSANKDKAYAVDEHFYKSPEWFLENIHRYDGYDRSMPKVFAGEYAAHTHEDTSRRACNWYAALCEAAFLTGLEKNADHVVMSCYAPLLARTGHQQWQPDLIWFDNESVYGTPSYYVQQLFGNNIGTSLVETVPEETEPQASLTGPAKLAGGAIQFSSTLSGDGKILYVKLVNLAETAMDVNLQIDRPVSSCSLHTLSAGLEDVNSHTNPRKVYPVTESLSGPDDTEQNHLQLQLKKYSVTVLECSLA